MNNDDDDDNYPGKLLHQAALYLNVDLLRVNPHSLLVLRVAFLVALGSPLR